jgi:hypothetical protein
MNRRSEKFFHVLGRYIGILFSTAGYLAEKPTCKDQVPLHRSGCPEGAEHGELSHVVHD